MASPPPPKPIWHGTYEEGEQLHNALKNNCECQTAIGVPVKTCAAHQAFMSSQRWLDDLLCQRRRRQQLLEQEYLVEMTPE